MAAVKICQAEMYMMYIDTDTSFMASHFQMFCDIIEDCSYAIQLEWVVDLNNESESLAYRILGHTYGAHSLNPVSGEKDSVSRADFAQIVAGVKGQCTSAAEMLVAELSRRFPDSDLMNALGIVFPQFWLQPNVDELFPLHLKTLKSHFCETKSVNKGTEKEPVLSQVSEPLDARNLDLQTSLFKLTMKSHAHSAMAEPRDANPVTKLWQKVGTNGLLLNRLSEFIKVAEIAITAVLGSVEDERTFSNLAFIKSKLRNRLGVHLDTCVRLFSQGFYSQDTFPYQEAITLWRDECSRVGAAL